MENLPSLKHIWKSLIKANVTDLTFENFIKIITNNPYRVKLTKENTELLSKIKPTPGAFNYKDIPVIADDTKGMTKGQ